MGPCAANEPVPPLLTEEKPAGGSKRRHVKNAADQETFGPVGRPKPARPSIPRKARPRTQCAPQIPRPPSPAPSPVRGLVRRAATDRFPRRRPRSRTDAFALGGPPLDEPLGAARSLPPRRVAAAPPIPLSSEAGAVVGGLRRKIEKKLLSPPRVCRNFSADRPSVGDPPHWPDRLRRHRPPRGRRPPSTTSREHECPCSPHARSASGRTTALSVYPGGG